MSLSIDDLIESLPDHLKEKIDVVDSHWLWNRSVNPRSGYDNAAVGKVVYAAHVVVWESLHGPVPIGLELGHTCEFKHCVRRVRPITHAENVTEGKSGQNWAAKTACPHGHTYTPENTFVNKKGSRMCRTCARLRARGIRPGDPKWM